MPLTAPIQQTMATPEAVTSTTLPVRSSSQRSDDSTTRMRRPSSRTTPHTAAAVRAMATTTLLTAVSAPIYGTRYPMCARLRAVPGDRDREASPERFNAITVPIGDDEHPGPLRQRRDDPSRQPEDRCLVGGAVSHHQRP